MAAAPDISWSGASETFNLRAAAVIRRGEPSEVALARELAEELGHQPLVGDLAFVVENIFANDGIQAPPSTWSSTAPEP